MSRRDDRPKNRAWDDAAPTLQERFVLAVRQNPVRGGAILLLLLLALAFLIATVVAFRILDWLVILGVGVLLLAVVLGGIGLATLLMRRD